MALCEGTKEAVWLAGLLEELKVKTTDSHVHVFSDSMSALKLIANPIFHDRTKHIAFKTSLHQRKVRRRKREVFIHTHFPTSRRLVDEGTASTENGVVP